MAATVADIIGRPIAFAEDCIGPKAETAVAAMKPGDILCVENTRFHKGEEKNDPAFVAALVKLGDLDDPFSAPHRAPLLMPAAACRRSSMRSRRRRKNQRVRSRLRRRKISTKLDLLGSLIAKVDVLIIAARWPTLSSPRRASGRHRCASVTSSEPRVNSHEGEQQEVRNCAAS